MTVLCMNNNSNLTSLTEQAITNCKLLYSSTQHTYCNLCTIQDQVSKWVSRVLSLPATVPVYAISETGRWKHYTLVIKTHLINHNIQEGCIEKCKIHLLFSSSNQKVYKIIRLDHYSHAVKGGHTQCPAWSLFTLLSTDFDRSMLNIKLSFKLSVFNIRKL